MVIRDEAHRSQYDTLAMNMRSALRNALFLAFTGTPLIAGEEKARDVFGDYVSIYDVQQSGEVPETNRGPRLANLGRNSEERSMRRWRGDPQVVQAPHAQPMDNGV